MRLNRNININENGLENDLIEKPSLRENKRDVNLDLIRFAAIFFLPSLHFFAYVDFYSIQVSGILMYVMSTVRTLSMICIPLFLLLTGYLMSNKKYSPAYFKGIIRVLVLFFICKTMIVVFYDHMYMHKTITLTDYIKGLSSGGEYSWYVGLYMWIYCLIPLFNIVYHSLDEKWKKQALLLAVFGVVALPQYANFYKADMPNLFKDFYPILYYFIGAYIREYHTDKKKWSYLALFFLSVVVIGAVSCLISHGSTFERNDLNYSWSSPFIAAMGVFLFIFLRKINMSKIPKALAAVLAKISEWSFGAYLLSWIFDNIFYPKLNAAVPEVTDRFKYYIIMVPLVLVCSLLLSAVANFIYKLLEYAVKKFYSLLKTRAAKAEN